MPRQFLTVVLPTTLTTVYCPRCGQAITVEASCWQAVECPKCGTAFVVQAKPGPSEVKHECQTNTS